MAPMCRWICTYSCTNWERKSAPVPGCSAVQCSVVAEPLHVSRSLAHDLALVIHELAINAWKHGYDGMSGGELAIHCGRTADGHLDLLVMDRGKGFGESTTTAAGHGLGKTGRESWRERGWTDVRNSGV